jgi:hypothetical protein
MLAFGKFRLSSFAGHRLGAPKLWPVACGLWSTGSSGQAMVETALIVPFLLFIVLNVINFGYFFVVAINLTAAPRSGALYSIQGSSTPGNMSLPPAGSGTAPAASDCTSTTLSPAPVEYLTNCDLYAGISSGLSAEVQVCTSEGASSTWSSSQAAPCYQYQSSPSYSNDKDLNAPAFVLNRVDVTYQFTPLVKGTVFNIYTLALPSQCSAGSCTFHRMAEMREMN